MSANALGADFIVIGAGIAGASVAYWLAAQGRTIVLERESQPGYHATGRSAAQYIASYGPPQARALTRASRAFLERPPQGFVEGAILTARGSMTVAARGQQDRLDHAWSVLQSSGIAGERLDADAVCAMVPVLRRERVLGAVVEPDSYDIDVHLLHQGYLRGMRQRGGELIVNAEVSALQRKGEHWCVTAGGRVYTAPIVVNAAGAWCDVVAGLAGVAPIGLVPKRRSAFTFKPPPDVDASSWPLVIAADESWYFKPDAGMLLGSPANADPTVPQDVQPEELDIATGMHLIEQMTTMSVRPAHKWAGLRSFVGDGELVGGFDRGAPGFFWLAGQGGYGIQSSAAMGESCASLIVGRGLPAHIAEFGVDEAMLSPARLPA